MVGMMAPSDRSRPRKFLPIGPTESPRERFPRHLRDRQASSATWWSPCGTSERPPHSPTTFTSRTNVNPHQMRTVLSISVITTQAICTSWIRSRTRTRQFTCPLRDDRKVAAAIRPCAANHGASLLVLGRRADLRGETTNGSKECGYKGPLVDGDDRFGRQQTIQRGARKDRATSLRSISR